MNLPRALVIAVVGLLLVQGAAAANPANGTWRMGNGKVTVRISDCGGKLCGRIVGLAKPLDKHGKPKRDKYNPNPALRSRPVIGITILNGLKPQGGDSWAGTIYNPDDGNTYTSVVKLVSPAKLKVKGCVAVLCKAMEFNRVN